MAYRIITYPKCEVISFKSITGITKEPIRQSARLRLRMYSVDMDLSGEKRINTRMVKRFAQTQKIVMDAATMMASGWIRRSNEEAGGALLVSFPIMGL
jgi:hypothetical protein